MFFIVPALRLRKFSKGNFSREFYRLIRSKDRFDGHDHTMIVAHQLGMNVALIAQ